MRTLTIALLVVTCAAPFSTPAPARSKDDLPPRLTLPASNRPAWVREHGIVMAGNWDPLIHRLRRDKGRFEPTDEERRLYESEHTPEMVRELKKLGVNFVMTHGYKGFGLRAELPGMQDAKRLADICHKEGMRVGVYFSGTSCWELLSRERPDSESWDLLDAEGKPVPYGPLTFRHFFNRNNKDLQAYYHPILDYAIREIKADLLHLDNYSYAAGYDKVSIGRFHEYLRRHGRPEDYGATSFASIMPPRASLAPFLTSVGTSTALGRAWLNFQCESMAESYYDFGKYARSVRPDILMECNPCGLHERTAVPMDHSRLLRYGEAFWEEGGTGESGYRDGKLYTRQLVYRTAQTMDNMAFMYIKSPVEAAESLAYNTDCLGCIAWFEWGRIRGWKTANNLNSDPVSPDLLPYVRFFHEQRPYYRDAIRLPDMAVLRSFASQRYAPGDPWQATHRFEQYCIENNVPWAFIFDQNLADLSRYRALCIVGADALSDDEVDRIKGCVQKGGGLVLTEESGKYDEGLKPRPSSPFADLTGPRVVRVKPDASGDEAVHAMKQACGGSFSTSIIAPDYVLAEMTEQTAKKRRLIHLVNFNEGVSVDNVSVDARVPTKWRVKGVVLIRPESPKPMALEFRQEVGRVKFTVPEISAYGLVSIEAGNRKGVK